MSEQRVNVWVHRRADTPNFQLEWLDPDSGKRKSRSAKTSDPEKAEQKRQELEYELNHGLHRGGSSMSWEQFRQLHEDEKLTGESENSQKKAGYVFDSFERLGWNKDRPIGRISERTISKYAAKLRENELSPPTIKGHLAYLKAALRWAVDQKIIAAVPKITMPKVPKGTNKAKTRAAGRITPEEFERLLMKCPNEGWRLLLVFAWHCGLRRHEARAVRGEDVDLKAHQIAIPENNADDEAATVFITPDLDRLLCQRWPDGLPEELLIAESEVTLDLHELSKQFRRIAKHASVRGSGKDGFCTMHDLRRNYGSRWAAKVPAQVLQRMMRHSDIKTTMEYYADVEQAALQLLWPEAKDGKAARRKRRAKAIEEVTEEVARTNCETEKSSSSQVLSH